MSAKLKDGVRAWVDPDDAPKLDGAFFDKAEIRRGGDLIRRGRPKSSDPKLQVTLRLDREVVEKFKAGGAGWQSRINQALRDAALKS
ncbi:MAG TPA: BrnA antitoxin family protein [Caulobacteraceae bacterium]